MKHSTDYTTEHWDYEHLYNAPTWKVIVWAVVLVVAFGVMWVWDWVTER